jgi:hypothetical protein
MRAETWKDDRVSGTCDRCGAPTDVGHRHYLSATAFHAPIWCVDCTLSEGGRASQASRSSAERRYQLASWRESR